jgi:hypothetical protein
VFWKVIWLVYFFGNKKLVFASKNSFRQKQAFCSCFCQQEKRVGTNKIYGNIDKAV